MLRTPLGRRKSLPKPKTAKPTTTKGSKSARHRAGEVALVLAGLLLIAGGVDNVGVTVLRVQVIAPGALVVQVVFVLAGLAVLLRGLDGLWGAEVRSTGGRILAQWRRWRAAGPPQRVAEGFPGVPPDRNLLFRDREADLERLRASLTLMRRVELSGLGGVGKSQLALEYLHRHNDDYPDGVFWVRGQTTATLSGDLAALAWLPRLMLDEREQRKQERVIEAVQAWLRDRTRWLLVIDNLDNAVIPTLTELLAHNLKGHVLVTSREPVWVPEPLSVEPMMPEVATAFLLERSRQTDTTAAATVAELLGGLPLALVQAAGYVRTSGRDLASYAELLRTRLAELLEEDRPADYPLPVAATWRLSLDRIEREQPAAAALLKLCAFLAPDDIPVSLLLECASELPAELRDAAGDEVLLDRAIGRLRRYSLVDRRGDGLRVHRLVQAVTRGWLTGDLRQRWLGAGLRLLWAGFPAEVDDPERWRSCARLLPHAQTILGLLGEEILEPHAASLLLDRVAGYLQARAEFAAAKPLYERALAIDEKMLGTDHPATAASLNNLALLLRVQGELVAARSLYERALTINERMLGPNHPHTAQSLNNLAAVLQAQDELGAARPLFERALDIRERILGPDHPLTAQSLNNLAALLKAQGELHTAKLLFERALDIRQRVLGPDHPLTAHGLNNLGSLLQAEGNLAAAKPYLERAVAIWDRVLGSDHPDIAHALNNLGLLLQAQGNLAAAKPYLERALAIREMALGPDHPDTIKSRQRLAAL